jgi:hypothetical protein
LDAVKAHNFTLNYSFFNPKFNMNVNMSYNFANNTIEERSWIGKNVDYPWIDESYSNTTFTTYENQGKNQGFDISTYLNWSPNPKFRIYSNLFGQYTNIKSKQYDLQNDGFSGRIFGGLQYTLPKEFMLNVNGYCGSPWIQLQGKGSSYYGTNFSASKSLLNKKLTLRAFVQNPFMNRIKSTSTISTPDFRMENITWRNQSTRFGISVNFRFGEMKAQIKKVSRGIQNDDNMGGGNSGGGESGGGGN